jgi:hypothetical protein
MALRSLSKSLSFIHRVIVHLSYSRTVRHRLEVDVIHLASFIRATCVALVVGYRYQRSRSFHSLVLPKDGLLETLARFLSAAPAFDTFTTELVVMICTRVQSIMDSIHSSVSPSECSLWVIVGHSSLLF